jgi:hypothetical protein
MSNRHHHLRVRYATRVMYRCSGKVTLHTTSTDAAVATRHTVSGSLHAGQQFGLQASAALENTLHLARASLNKYVSFGEIAAQSPGRGIEH